MGGGGSAVENGRNFQLVGAETVSRGGEGASLKVGKTAGSLSTLPVPEYGQSVWGVPPA